jgi:Tol biopolymer transport system component
MSPEQAKGLETDRATDIWAFGCVLFEMLAGHPPFSGATTTEILAEILKSEPDWSRLPAETPEQIRQLLRRCLQKGARSRFRDIADVRMTLEDARSSNEESETSPKDSSVWRVRVAWAVALLAVFAALFFVFRPVSKPLETHVDIATPPPADGASLAISADGREIAFTALTESRPVLWLRSLSSHVARPLPGTEGAALPFWSPKGHTIGFFAQGKLKRIDVDTGEIRVLAEASANPSGGTWNADGVILYSPKVRGSILRINEDGGPTTTLIESGIAPRFFPDGRRFLFRSPAQIPALFVGTLDGSPPQKLNMEGNSGIPASAKHILYLRGGLFLQAFDPDKNAVIGNPIKVADSVSGNFDGATPAISVSDSGDLVYRASTADGRTRRFAWFDRSGNQLSQVGEIGGFSPDMAPDGRWLTLSRSVGGTNIWLLDTARGVPSQLTMDPAGAQVSEFSPDGTQIVFSSARLPQVSLFKRDLNSGKEELLLQTSDNLVAADWSPHHLLFRSNNNETGFDIWALPMRGNERTGDPIPVVRSKYSERDAQFSPDEKWIAYESDRSGTSEIYIQSFPGPGPEQVISKGGGVQARWNPKRNELFYISLDGQLMSVTIRFASDGSVVADNPAPLFRTRMGPVFWGVYKQQYLVSDDGQRFLISIVADDGQSPIHLIQNWRAIVE